MIGQRLCHYRILEKLGQGGMGVVSCAHDERSQREVALKLLPAEIVTRADRRARAPGRLAPLPNRLIWV